MSSPAPPPSVSKETHLHYLRQTIRLAHKSPPKPTNFRVGCVIVSYPPPPPSSFNTSAATTDQTSTQNQDQTERQNQSQGKVISTGYTLELPGNTHAEQSALGKLLQTHNLQLEQEEGLDTILTPEANVTLYTSLEPCAKRLSGNKSCVQRIIDTRTRTSGAGVRKVVFGAKEPGVFVQDSQSCRLLSEAGIEWEYIPDLEEEILKVAMEGHEKKENKSEERKEETKVTNITDISEEEKKRQAALPRNPKKRVMEAPPG